MKRIKIFAVTFALTLIVCFGGCAKTNQRLDEYIEYSVNIYYQLDGAQPYLHAVKNYTAAKEFTLGLPRCDGYSFSYWTGDGINGKLMDFTIPIGSVGIRSYTAHFEKIPENSNIEIRKAYDGKLTSQILYKKYTQGQPFTLGAPLLELGYKFLGYQGDGIGDALVSDYTIPQDASGVKSFVAHYKTMANYKVEFLSTPNWEGRIDLGDRTESVVLSGQTQVEVAFNDRLRQIPVVSGYKETVSFAGWDIYVDGVCISYDDNGKHYVDGRNFISANIDAPVYLFNQIEEGKTVTLRPFFTSMWT